MSDDKEPEKTPSGNLTGTTIGLNLVAGMAVFSYLGYLIDQKTGGGQGWTLGGIFLGLIYGGYEIWKLIRQLNK